ncbi:hypothetical protein K2173_008661 [Erythroxylum novogranatense]|uniref:Uncharacterized protein n=1 Tax=Erythroxylum novogranatense TaxID=1862640 RepID=A0AAV8SLP2_9ROSI|nr:hypothetical protein K2173_008661 [Erythroxylum novogranatense]
MTSGTKSMSDPTGIASCRLCFELADNVSLQEGATCELLSVCVHVHRRANVGPDTNVLVMGAGPIGLFSFNKYSDYN